MIMETTELRIGNLVLDTITQEPIKLTIDLLKWLDQNNKTELNQFSLCPILLTEEWLIKFGFEKQEWVSHNYRFPNKGIKKETGYVYREVWVFILIDNNLIAFGRRNTDPRYSKNSWSFNENGITPTYVHEFQNLFFALTRNELEINC